MKSCKRCGWCCRVVICQIGEMVYGLIEPPCPALIKKGKRYSCAFVKVENEFFLEPILVNALGIGKGCDSE